MLRNFSAGYGQRTRNKGKKKRDVGKNISKHQQRERQKAEKLQWALREWNCDTIAEAKRLAKTDKELSRVLRECGVKFTEKSQN